MKKYSLFTFVKKQVVRNVPNSIVVGVSFFLALVFFTFYLFEKFITMGTSIRLSYFFLGFGLFMFFGTAYENYENRKKWKEILKSKKGTGFATVDDAVRMLLDDEYVDQEIVLFVIRHTEVNSVHNDQALEKYSIVNKKVQKFNTSIKLVDHCLN
jgi:hypothetical protein